MRGSDGAIVAPPVLPPHGDHQERAQPRPAFPVGAGWVALWILIGCVLGEARAAPVF